MSLGDIRHDMKYSGEPTISLDYCDIVLIRLQIVVNPAMSLGVIPH